MISELTGPTFQPCAHTMLKLPAQWVAEIWCRSVTKWMLLALDVLSHYLSNSIVFLFYMYLYLYILLDLKKNLLKKFYKHTLL